MIILIAYCHWQLESLDLHSEYTQPAFAKMSKFINKL